MRRLKGILGSLLIIGSITGIVLWEGILREELLFADVICAKEDILKGVTITNEMLEACKVPKEQLVNGFFKPSEKEMVLGERSKQFIPKNAQIVNRYVDTIGMYPQKGESIFKINKEWISMMSTSLRRGDEIHIISVGDWEWMGDYKVAFVKDNAGREVQTISGGNDEVPFDRLDGTYVADYVEIIGNLESYQRMMNKAGEGATFLLIQRGE